ncbi:MAG TPA: PEP-CTERM sorting domain-containing protein [Pyrinomonadaceae bacterium]|nr:PEP-CTERM sorting domain-containing protein [Pyrinomonadaceae bacterium]
MSRIFGGLCTLFLIVLFTPALTRADPIVVTGGNVMVAGIGGGPTFTLTGNNFSATSLGGDFGNFASQKCSPCLAGTLLGVGGSFLGSQVGGGGTANINGTLFTNVGWSGQMSLSGGTIIVPFALDDVTITVPATFTATLSGCSGSCLVNPTIFTVELVGSGTAILELNFSGLDQFGTPIFVFQKFTLQFEEVPEPASIMLLGGGLALLTAKLRRRFSSQNDSGIG